MNSLLLKKEVFEWHPRSDGGTCNNFEGWNKILHHDYQPGYDPVYWLYMNMPDPITWQKITVNGWIHPDDLTEDVHTSVKIEVETIKKKAETERPQLEENAVVWDCLDINALYFTGEIELNKHNAIPIVQAYFKADEFL